ncbi:sugar phosphate isomerase/epimerase [Klebsiella pneumoniae]|nr:sugar phosphate isomerase/epimerase [Klebsiella pneumoniae]
MKLGVFATLFQNIDLPQALDIIADKGLEAVEIGTGGFPGNHHCNPHDLLKNKSKLKQFKDLFSSRGLIISALSCHGNPLHPNKDLAQSYDRDFRNTLDLACELEIPVVVGFSGCPGDSDNAKYPNWPVAPWPNDFGELLEWQWKEKLIPYWQDIASKIRGSGVKIALEMHGGFLVHTPYTLLKLREATSQDIGANLDPSHMWWQGIDPVEAIKLLGKSEALHYFHAKDTTFDQNNQNMYGLTDMQSYANHLTRAWNFRSVGYGHDLKVWSDIMSTLRMTGYDYVVSIEHEDGLMSIDEGLSKAIFNLKNILIKQPATEMWWI